MSIRHRVDMTSSPEFSALLTRCVEARKRFEASECEYLAFIVSVEDDPEKVWQQGFGTFTEFLQNVLGKPEPGRYANYKEAVSTLGLGEVESIGVDAAMQSLKVRSPEQRRTYHEAVHAWSAERGGVHPSAQYARDIRQQIAPMPSIPAPLQRSQALEVLRAENAALRQENRRLKTKCEHLEKEVEKLRGSAVGARKRTRNGPESLAT
jgi:cell division protein FtsB